MLNSSFLFTLILCCDCEWYCQATGTGTWDWESKIENRNSPSADSKISQATTTTHPQLLTMKEMSDNKVPLVRMS